MMRASASIELIWNMAAQEAIATEFAEVQPEHFLEAILKFVELPLEELARLAPTPNVARELVLEIGNVQKELQSRTIDSTHVRRELRTRLGAGKQPFTGGQLHRSQGARDMFDVAARLADDAQSEALATEHLLQSILQSPTPVMQEVLGEALGPKVPEPVETPLLDEHGQDLVRMAAEGTSPKADRGPECNMLLRLLADASRRSVVLVTDREGAARSVVLAAAHILAGPERPAALRGKQIVDVTGLDPVSRGSAETLQQLDRLLAEAARAPQVVLLVPPIRASPESKDGDPWIKLLGKTMCGSSIQCICEAQPATYERWIRKDKDWKQRIQVMWVGEGVKEEIPWTL